MPTTQTRLDTGDLGAWARLLRRNANHHAKAARATVAKIVGYVLLYHDLGTLRVSAGSKYRNFGTAEFNGRRLAFSYSHQEGAVQVREGSVRGKTIRSFNDRSGDMEILRFFTSLLGGR